MAELNWWEDESGEVEAVSTVSNHGTVYLDGEFLDHDIVRVNVLIEDLQTPVLGIAFHLRYEAGELAFLRYDPGEFLERGGDPFYLVMASRDGAGAEAGEIVFGETLRRNDDFPIGDGVVAEFYFQELSPSDAAVYEFGFENGVVSTLDTVRQDLDGVVFEDFVLDEVGRLKDTGFEIDGVQIVSGGKYSANVAGGAFGFEGGVIWLVLGLGVLFSASFWYFFKAKTKRKFADFDEGG